jgi:hypothetical protein
MICTECKQDEDCRPYGHNGAYICFDCAMKDEERTNRNFLAQLEAAAKQSSTVIIGEETGPRPMNGVTQ